MLSLTGGGCVTTQEVPVPGSEPNLEEAAKLNTQLGIDYMRKGQLDLALEKLKKALDQDPDLATAHSSIAFVYARRGENRLAEKHYRKALNRNADDPFTLNNFGVFLCGQGELEDAEKYFLKAAHSKDYATPEAALTNAGVCLRREPKQAARAEQYFREALRRNPQFPDALVQMAQLTHESGDYLRARAFLQRYESVARSTPQSLWIGARNERRLGDMQSARAYERRLKTEFPDAAETYELLNNSAKP
ncbi:MAG: type IV pilus biogenesis/stability protein PilW [Hydrocarboniphaga effusa]|nr:type IV pilus biogenesis/stability protein PilW [Hydrocarboniphaga effusa]